MFMSCHLWNGNVDSPTHPRTCTKILPVGGAWESVGKGVHAIGGMPSMWWLFVDNLAFGGYATTRYVLLIRSGMGNALRSITWYSVLRTP